MSRFYVSQLSNRKRHIEMYYIPLASRNTGMNDFVLVSYHTNGNKRSYTQPTFASFLRYCRLVDGD